VKSHLSHVSAPMIISDSKNFVCRCVKKTVNPAVVGCGFL